MSIILQQSCNYKDRDKIDKINEYKIDKIRENIKKTYKNLILFNYRVFYITNSNNISCFKYPLNCFLFFSIFYNSLIFSIYSGFQSNYIYFKAYSFLSIGQTPLY